MEMELACDVTVRSVGGTERVLSVAALFGLGLGESERVRILEPIRLRVEPGNVVLVTGASGSGKSTILRLMREEFEKRGERVVRLEEMAVDEESAVIDCFGHVSLERAMECLARAGLAEAFVMMRRVKELSEGQRFRFKLALFYASEIGVLIADEFAATLDRITARVVAYQLGKFVRASRNSPTPRIVLLATTHEDLTADLSPHMHLYKEIGAGARVTTGNQEMKMPSSTKEASANKTAETPAHRK